MAGKFPRPYVEEAKEDRTTMEYVDGDGGGFSRMGIGARKSGMPKGEGPTKGGMSIDHVGGTPGGKK